MTEVVNQQKRMEDMTAALLRPRLLVESPSAKAEVERLSTRLTALRNQRDDLRLELKSLAAEAELAPHEAAAAEYWLASEKYEKVKIAYEKLFERLERFQSLFNSCGDYVAVQERATPAAEHVEDWRLPVAVGAVGGGAAAGLVGFLLSLVIVRAPRTTVQPPV